MRTKRRIKKKIITMLILIVEISIISFASVKLIVLYKDSYSIKKIEQIIDSSIVEEVIEDEESTIIVENSEPEESLFFQYVQTPLIDVNLEELIDLNDETVGWIKVGGTSVNAPFVQTNDNSYYLTYDFLNEKNVNGWIFADYRNSVDLTDKNLILYGHNTIDSSIFGTLKTVLEQSWFDDTQNHIINMSLSNANALWQVVSVYKVESTIDYIETNFTDESFIDFLDLISNRSIFDFNTTLSTTDKILTLSTCSSNNTRVVLHAKLIKYTLK
ncbi:MAG: class B sortase [Mycoplasmatota bacterium]